MTIIFDEEKKNQQLKQMRLDEDERLVRMLSDRHSIPYINLGSVSINTDAMRLLSQDEAKKSECVIFDIIGKKIHLAIYNPENPYIEETVDGLKRKGYEVIFHITSIFSLEKAYVLYKDLSFAVETEAGSLDISDNEIEELIKKTESLDDVKILIDEALKEKKSHRLSKLLAVIMAGGLATKASDIHIEAEDTYAKLRYRIDGVLIEATQFELDTYHPLLSRLKLLSGLKLNIKDNAQDGRFTIKIYTTDIEIRVSMIPGSYGESIVMRILNPKAISSGLEDLGFSKKLYDLTIKEINRPNGLILLTGPTGSGKTTTLYAFLKKTMSPEYKIITIEDPVEYHLPGVVQTQVDDAKGYTFNEGLRSIVRQDPDIILVGEIRDGETANIAIQASLTGHLVFSTLHTNNAAGTFIRLMNLGADPKTLTSSLHLVIAQRLVRTLCIVCKKLEDLSEREKTIIQEVITSLDGYEELSELNKIPEKLYHAVGCKECNNTGYKGRIGVHEAMLSTEKIEQVIAMNPSEREIVQAALEQKLISMKQDGIIKITKGFSTLEELERVVDIY
jgi:type IV pilus assembly protein PilB